MTLPVCQVTVTLPDQAGQPVVGAMVAARLSAPIIYEGVVVPLQESATTDSTGRCVLSLVPNSIGTVPTTYTFEVWPPNAPRAAYFRNITVPNVASTTLEALLGFVPANLTVWDDSLTWDEGDGSPQWIEP